MCGSCLNWARSLRRRAGGPNVIERRKVQLILYTIARRTNGRCAGKRLRQQNDIFPVPQFRKSCAQGIIHHLWTHLCRPFVPPRTETFHHVSNLDVMGPVCFGTASLDSFKNIFAVCMYYVSFIELRLTKTTRLRPKSLFWHLALTAVSYKSNKRYEFCSRKDPARREIARLQQLEA